MHVHATKRFFALQETALKDENLCRRLVQQQHMQHQGWAAVIANLEDCASAFSTARTIFEKSFRRFAAEKEQRWPFIQSFIDDDMNLLRRIPIFPCFAPWRSYAVGAVEDLKPPCFTSEHFKTGDVTQLQREETACTTGGTVQSLADSTQLPQLVTEPADNTITSLTEPSFYSMLEWINQASHCTVESLINNCITAFNAIDESDTLEDLLEDSAEIAERANAMEMKHVKGLSDRLFGLEQLQIELSKLAKAQTETVQAFVQSCSTAVLSSSPSTGGSNLDSQMISRDTNFMPSLSSSPTMQRGSSRVGSPSGVVFISSGEDARQAEILRRMQNAHKKIGDIR